MKKRVNSPKQVARSIRCNGSIQTKTHICEGIAILSAKCQSRLVGCGNFETTEGLRTDSSARDVDSHNIVCSWCAHKKLIEILLYRMPAEGIPEEGIAGGEILASRVPNYGTKDAGRGLWLRLKYMCKHSKFSLNQILPTLFTLRDDESNIIAVMSSNVDDLLYGYLPEGIEAMNSVLQQFLEDKEEHGTFRFCWERVPARRGL